MRDSTSDIIQFGRQVENTSAQFGFAVLHLLLTMLVLENNVTSNKSLY